MAMNSNKVHDKYLKTQIKIDKLENKLNKLNEDLILLKPLFLYLLHTDKTISATIFKNKDLLKMYLKTNENEIKEANDNRWFIQTDYWPLEKTVE